MLRIVESKDVNKILKRRASRLEEAEQAVRPILDAVRKRGDAALLEYARKFDKLARRSVKVPQAELEAAWKKMPRELQQAVKTASACVRETDSIFSMHSDSWRTFDSSR